MADPSETPVPAAPEVPAESAGASGVAGPPPSSPPPPPDPVTQLRTEVAQTLAQYRSDTETALRTIVGLIQQQVAAGDAPPADTETLRAKVREQLEQDPEAAIDAIVSKRIGPILRETAERTGLLAREEAARRATSDDWGDEWQTVAKDVDAFMAGVPTDQHLNPDTWYNAFQLVLLQKDRLGKAAMTRHQRKMEREQAMASEGASPGRVGPRGPAPLSDLEKRMAKACDMTEDEWRHQRAALEPMTE